MRVRLCKCTSVESTKNLPFANRKYAEFTMRLLLRTLLSGVSFHVLSCTPASSMVLSCLLLAHPSPAAFSLRSPARFLLQLAGSPTFQPQLTGGGEERLLNAITISKKLAVDDPHGIPENYHRFLQEYGRDG